MKIVIKIGSSIITSEDESVDVDFLNNLSLQIKYLIDLVKQVIVVSSETKVAGVN